MNLKVSIIIPFYNQGNYIEETLLSVLSSTFQNFEIIIIDDGSNDDNRNKLLQITQKINDNRIQIFHQHNSGPSSARNFALKKSKGDYLVFVDGDDCILSNSLQFMLDNIKDNHLMFGDCIYFGEIEGLKKQKIPTNQEIFIGNPIAVCCMVKRDLITNIQFDNNLDKLGLEDWEFFMNIFKNELSIVYFPVQLFKIRVVKNSRTFEIANKNKDLAIRYIMNKHSDFLFNVYSQIYYENKQLKELIDLRIGKKILSPYRFFKKILINFVKK
jgi:glycosyltransferase involved in cell wall biosynthesis